MDIFLSLSDLQTHHCWILVIFPLKSMVTAGVPPPLPGPVVYVLDLADRLISKAGPFAAAGIMVGSIYWTAVTYGAVTVMQVVGHKEGLDVMERADPLFLLIGLPTIPVMLILGKMIRWEDYVLRLWRKYSNKLQILNSIFPGPSIGAPQGLCCHGDAGKNS